MTRYEASASNLRRAEVATAPSSTPAAAKTRDTVARVAPFAVYVLFLAAAPACTWLRGEGWLPSAFDLRWLYGVQIACVSAALWWFRRDYIELHSARALSAPDLVWSVGCGAVVFGLWINLDFAWMTLGTSAGFSPLNPAGEIDWALAITRVSGAAVIVPVMEELFWRSFVMRWIKNMDFLSVSPARVGAFALLVSSVLFGLEHQLWFAGVITGLMYGALYIRTKKLWTCVIAHAVTNAMLGGWVLYTRSWQFW